MAEIIARNDNELTIQVTIKLTGSLLEMENTILDVIIHIPIRIPLPL